MLPRKSQEGKVTQLQWGLALLCPYPSENGGGGGGGGGLCPTPSYLKGAYVLHLKKRVVVRGAFVCFPKMSC